MIQHPLGEHLATCSSPENCAEYGAVLSMTPTQYANYLNESTARFAQTRTASARTLRTSQVEDSPPGAYGPALAARRAADATPMSRFEDRYRSERLAAFAAEYARAGALPPIRVLSASELAEYSPPNIYTLALDARREKL